MKLPIKRARARRVTYSNVVATIAIVFAMTGGAMAASHYVITSAKQIKPSVLKKLKRNTGPKGATGHTGPAGAPNPNATAVDGQTVSKIFENLARNMSTPVTFFTGDGLTMSALCDSSDHLSLYAQSSDPNAEFNDSGNLDGTFVDNEKENTGTGTFQLYNPSSFHGEGSLQIAYSTATGKAVTIDIGTDYAGAFGNGNDCGVWGTAFSSS